MCSSSVGHSINRIDLNKRRRIVGDELESLLMLVLDGAVDGGVSELSAVISVEDLNQLYARMGEALDHNPMRGEEESVEDLLAFLSRDLWVL
jgi:hypothetical protein